jgi:stage III sporulation protein SpoIIIAA
MNNERFLDVTILICGQAAGSLNFTTTLVDSRRGIARAGVHHVELSHHCFVINCIFKGVKDIVSMNDSSP